MNILRRMLLMALCLLPAAGGAVLAQVAEPLYEPTVGQEGKDVVWVPTPHILTERMLDMAKVTPQDYVMDLGSGDGRNVIAAARRGARGRGVEYNADLVALSRRLAAKAGVDGRAVFVQGDMYEADISEATVLALFLLPENLIRLTPKFLDLQPGSRIVANGFGIEGWDADETSRVEGDCEQWCTAYLYIVPAKAAGTWTLPRGTLTLQQSFQKLTGSLDSDGRKLPLTNGRLLGDQITFTAGGTDYAGRVNGEAIEGADGAWRAVRARP